MTYVAKQAIWHQGRLVAHPGTIVSDEAVEQLGLHDQVEKAGAAKPKPKPRLSGRRKKE